MKKDRREFLKNTTLASLALGISPIIGKASTREKRNITNLQTQSDCSVLTQDYYGEGLFILLMHLLVTMVSLFLTQSQEQE